MALFEPARHEPLIDRSWDEGTARAALERIVADTHAAYRGPEGLWKIHPMDVSPERADVLKYLYYGAAGVIWTLNWLAEEALAPEGPDYDEALSGLESRALDDHTDPAAPAPLGFHTGAVGILMVQAKLCMGEETLKDLAFCMGMADADRTNSLIWGLGGQLLAASTILDETGDATFRALGARLAAELWDRWTWNEAAGCHLWTQDLYGDQACQLGALHGFAGNACALLRTRHFLTPDRQDDLFARIRQTLTVSPRREGGLVNWPFEAGGSSHPASGAIRVQHCMGAPGIINTMAGLPSDAEINALLLGGGELTWAAGPLAKHPCLCHGTPGNGYAFLKLFARTGDQLWLDRARAFAMHAIAQNHRFVAETGQRKFSLWTGDLGLACYLGSCLKADPRFPTLDVF